MPLLCIVDQLLVLDVVSQLLLRQAVSVGFSVFVSQNSLWLIQIDLQPLDCLELLSLRFSLLHLLLHFVWQLIKGNAWLLFFLRFLLLCFGSLKWLLPCLIRFFHRA